MRLRRMFPYIAGLALAVLMCTTVVVQAQTIISNETLKTTTFVVNKQNTTAKCGKKGCQAITPMFAPIPVTCPAAVGETCTFHISLDTKVSVAHPPSCHCLGQGPAGIFQFSIDGVAPTIGPTNMNGIYFFEVNGFTNNIAPHEATRLSYPASVLTTVTNSSSSNAHTIMVNVGCSDTLQEGGCKATAHWSTMRVDVFEP